MGLFYWYRRISPYLHQIFGVNAGCRFYPTCSSYAEAAVGRYGFLKGAALGARRIARCNPFNPGGYDPLP